jgi:pSer/pThr/pTyr-binding forkhead associated (FHA) protein
VTERLVAVEGRAIADCTPGRPLMIGRAGGDLVVPLGVVSRQHCWVTSLGDRYTVADLGSANGTLLCRPDGSTVTVAAEPVELHPGDVIATARGRRPIVRFEAAASEQ